MPAIAVTFGVAVTYGQTRFRAAAEPSLAVLAAVAVVALVSLLSGHGGSHRAVDSEGAGRRVAAPWSTRGTAGRCIAAGRACG